jgi:hypothetical protein
VEGSDERLSDQTLSVTVSVTVTNDKKDGSAVTTDRTVSYQIGAARFELATS